MHRSPGTLYPIPVGALTPQQTQLELELRSDVEALSSGIGPRHGAHSYGKLLEAEQWLLQTIADMGLAARRVEVNLGAIALANVEVSIGGGRSAGEIIVIGAHYDTVPVSPGANDNASGVALLLATLRALRDDAPDRTLRVVFFVNEESPFSGGVQMGSRVYAESCRAARDHIVAMINVDSVGYFSAEPGSQHYPPFVLGLPTTGGFVGFGSNRENIPLLDRVVELFQHHSRFPSIGIASDSTNAARGDHAPFWWQDYPAIMISDTSEFRDPHYHSASDRAENLNYEQMSILADGFIATIRSMLDARTTIP